MPKGSQSSSCHSDQNTPLGVYPEIIGNPSVPGSSHVPVGVRENVADAYFVSGSYKGRRGVAPERALDKLERKWTGWSFLQ
jgi:hypothetical protein